MVDVDFIKRFIENEDPHLIERGETIPVELSEYLEDKPFSRFAALLKTYKKGTVTDERYKVELRCANPECGRLFIHECSRNELPSVIANKTVMYRMTDGSIIHEGRRLCPNCYDKAYNEFLRCKEIAMEEEAIRLAEKKRQKELEEEEKKEKLQKLIDKYLVPASVDNANLSFAEARAEIESDNSALFRFRRELRDRYNKDKLYQTVYWALVFAEKRRLTVNPSCFLTGETTDLQIIYCGESSVGKELEGDFGHIVFVSASQILIHGLGEITRQINAIIKNSYSPTGNMRTYYMTDILPFGQYKGKVISDMMELVPDYFIFLHTKYPSFDILDPWGKSIFEPGRSHFFLETKNGNQ